MSSIYALNCHFNDVALYHGNANWNQNIWGTACPRTIWHAVYVYVNDLIQFEPYYV